MRRTRSFTLGAVVIAGTLLSTALPGGADLIVPDGNDTDGVISHSDLAMGEVCSTTGTDGYNGGNGQAVALYLQRSSNAATNGDKVWANSTNVGFTAAETHAAIDVDIEAPGYLTTPSGWTSESGGFRIGPLDAPVRVETTTLGLLTGTGPQRKVTFTAAGEDHAAGTTTLQAAKDIQVSATIVNETTATSMDCTLPTAAITNPVTPQPDYDQGSSQLAAYACEDPFRSGGGGVTPSGIASCTGVVTKPDASTLAVASGAALPTADLGVHTLTVTPTDNVGNVGAAVSRTYNVVAVVASTDYYGRFGQPLDPNGVLNKAKTGRTVPVKVEVISGTDQTELENEGPVRLQTSTIPCDAGAPSDAVESYSTGSANTGYDFRWDATGGHWIYNLDTSKLPGAAAGKCYRVDVILGGQIVNGAIVDGDSLGYFKVQLTK